MWDGRGRSSESRVTPKRFLQRVGLANLDDRASNGLTVSNFIALLISIPTVPALCVNI
jgi:hypothetical protein